MANSVSQGDRIASLADSISEEMAMFLRSVPFLRYFATLFAFFLMARPGIIAVVLLTPASAAFLATSGFPAIKPSLLGAVALSFAIASAHIFNDYCDVEVDRMNPRAHWRPLVTGLVSRSSALIVSILFAVISLICAFLINLVSVVILICGIALIFSYSAWLKRTVWGFIPPALAAFLIPLGAYSAYNPSSVLSLSAILFALTGFFFELIPYWCQTFPDVEGDRARGIPTITIKLGTRPASLVIAFCFICCAICLFLLGSVANFGGFCSTVVICGEVAVGLTIFLFLLKPSGQRAIALYFVSLTFIGAVALAIILETGWGVRGYWIGLGREVLDYLSSL